MSRPALNPHLAVLLGVIAVSFGSIFVKAAEAPPLVVAFYRIGFTVLLLLPVTLATGRRELLAMGRRDLALACGAGVMLALHFATWITSLSYTSIASSTVLVNMHPLFAIAGGYLFYREGVNLRGLLGAALALAGSIVIGFGDFGLGGQALYGDLLAFAGAFFVAGYMLVGRGIRGRLSLFPYIIIVYGVTALVLLLAVLAFGQPLYPYPAVTWLMFLLLAVVPTIFGHTVFNWALRYVNAAVVSVSILGEPVGATILAYFIFSQVPGVMQLAGGVMIITGLVVFILSNNGRSRKPAG